MKKSVFASTAGIFLLIVAVGLLPALGIIVFTGLEQGKALEESVKKEALRQIEILSFAQERSTESIHQTLITLASLGPFREENWAVQQSITGRVISNNPEYVNIASVDSDGIVRASSRLAVGTDLSDRMHVQAALRGEGFVAGEYILARVDSEPSFPFAQTLRDGEGRIIGALTVVNRLSEYSRIFDELDLPEESILGITDHRGIRLFFHPQKDTNPVGKPIKNEVWQAVCEGGDAGTIYQTGSDNIARFYTFRKMSLPGTDSPYLTLILGIPTAQVTAPSRQILRRNIILIGITALTSIALSAFLGYVSLGHKLLVLTKSLASIESGDLSARTGLVNKGGGIAVVAGAIDRMAAALEQRNRERDVNERQLSNALAEKEILLREIHHRVKNNLQLMLSIIRLERQSEADMDIFMAQIENRIRSIVGVHELMYESEDIGRVGTEDFLKRLASMSKGFAEQSAIVVEAEDHIIDTENLVPLALITNELIINSLKHGASDDGTVRIRIVFAVESGNAHLTVSDEGPGFPPEQTGQARESLGMLLINALAEQIKGRVAIDRERSTGAAVTISFPLFTVLSHL